jgi:predicted amidophosphoribosyltransferase
MSIAEDTTIGLICSNCGTPFTKEHDYPVWCKVCFKAWKAHNRQGRQKFMEQTGCQPAIYEQENQ